ncbi:MAG: nucleotidyltransferase family protein [Candidatus Omnitrophica bacterium]|nr:nucleotidyltransferase family protein [Candidatus Omnitrophota bacterium]
MRYFKSSELYLIRNVFQAVINGGHKNEIKRILENKHINWEILDKLIIYHEIAPAFYLAISSLFHLIPQKTKTLLEWFYFNTGFKNHIIFEEFIKLYDKFKEKGIEILPIKGVAFLLDLYDSFYVRSIADIDILIRREYYSKGESVLMNLGFQKDLHGLEEAYWKLYQCHISFRDKEKNNDLPIMVDLHWALDFKRKGRYVLANLWKRLRTIRIKNNNNINLLSPEDNLFSLALHLRRFGNPFSFKYVIDTALLFRKYGSDFDWDYFLKEAKKEGLWSCSYFLIFLANSIIEIPELKYSAKKIPLSNYKRKIIEKLILKKLCFLNDLLAQNLRKNYLQSHFLFYDGFFEPIYYILNIPLEQFAKFYNLKPYNQKTRIKYSFRFLYIPTKLLFFNFNNIPFA